MKINDFLNDNFIILKTMYDNQVRTYVFFERKFLGF